MNNKQNGQVGLVVLLIAAVLLTLGIGVASQSVLETKTATQESDSSAIFNVTERAIEEALRSLTEGTTTIDGVPVTTVENTDSYTSDVSEGDTAQLNLETGTTIPRIRWADSAGCGAAIVVALIGGSEGQTVTRYAFDEPECQDDHGDNGFISANDCSGGWCEVLALGLPSEPKLARIKVLYEGTTVEATLTNAPPQSYTVTAQGRDSGTGETRNIQATRSMPSVPSIFDYALFSGTGISK